MVDGGSCGVNGGVGGGGGGGRGNGGVGGGGGGGCWNGMEDGNGCHWRNGWKSLKQVHVHAFEAPHYYYHHQLVTTKPHYKP